MKLRSRVVPVAIHLALLVVALPTLPLSIAGGWGDPPPSGYALWLLALFAVSIGLPFFALAANNPLLQAGSSVPDIPTAPDPYSATPRRISGSFLALLSYPVLLEPMLTLARAEPAPDWRLRPSGPPDCRMRRAVAPRIAPPVADCGCR